MGEKRIIPALSLDRDGRVVEAVALPALGDPGDPAAVAVAYAAAGADELFFDGRDTATDALIDVTRRVTGSSSVPLLLAREHGSVQPLQALKQAGAARLAIGVSALRDPNFITGLARAIGSDSVLVAMEALGEDEHWRVDPGPGAAPAEWDAVIWARVVQAQGGGGLIVASRAATQESPFDLELLKAVAAEVRIPVLAAGAAGAVEDVLDALMIGEAEGVLVGSLLHSGRASIEGVRRYLAEHGLGD